MARGGQQQGGHVIHRKVHQAGNLACCSRQLSGIGARLHAGRSKARDERCETGGCRPRGGNRHASKRGQACKCKGPASACIPSWIHPSNPHSPPGCCGAAMLPPPLLLPLAAPPSPAAAVPRLRAPSRCAVQQPAALPRPEPRQRGSQRRPPALRWRSAARCAADVAGAAGLPAVHRALPDHRHTAATRPRARAAPPPGPAAVPACRGEPR